jgi:hypothetical protein
MQSVDWLLGGVGDSYWIFGRSCTLFRLSGIDPVAEKATLILLLKRLPYEIVDRLQGSQPLDMTETELLLLLINRPYARFKGDKQRHPGIEGDVVNVQVCMLEYIMLSTELIQSLTTITLLFLFFFRGLLGSGTSVCIES